MTRGRASGRMAAEEIAQVRREQKESGRKKSVSKYVCASGVDPVIKEIFARAEAQKINLEFLAKRIGTLPGVLYKWRTGRFGGTLNLVQAAVGALGGRLVVEWHEGQADAPNGHALPSKAPPPDLSA